MLNFEYKGISQGKYVEGEIEALNNAEAAHKLKDQKVIITKLKEAKKKKAVVKKEKTSFSFGTGIKAQEILIFCKQFATMLRAGLPVLNTLEMLIGQTATPGMKKSDFQIEVEEGVLIISSDTDTQSNETETSFTRKEFGYHSFKRSFNIPDTIYVDRISATYKEGILTVSLPKKEEALPQPKKLVSIK